MKKEYAVKLLLILFLTIVGGFYAGPLFINNITYGIPFSSTADTVIYMQPGDHHEQFYRYSLVYENIKRGYLPYFTGYQYATTEFSEGLIFFPFTLIVGLMSFLFGPILSYNLFALMSFGFVGLGGYLMVKQITKSTMAGFVCGVFLATVPFRTSFLFGQMIYGVDAVLLPLFIYYIERAKELGKVKYFIIASVVLFLILTSNIQNFYWGMLLLMPYIAHALITHFLSASKNRREKIIAITSTLPMLIASLFYVIFIYTIIKDSALSGGQNFMELYNYNPGLKNLFTVFNGNEKNIYFGFTAIIIISVIMIYGITNEKFENKQILILFSLIFLFSLFVILGPSVDRLLSIKLYEWVFNNIPGVNGTRTTGRVFAVAVVCYAVILGIVLTLIDRKIRNNGIRFVIAGALSMGIVMDFHYTRPGISLPLKNNAVYEHVRDSIDNVLILPFQYESNHHYNSSHLPLALKYNIRMFSGHSSMYPASMINFVERLYTINSGDITREQIEWLLENKYKHIIVHNTAFQPAVGVGVLTALLTSDKIEFIEKDNDIYLFEIVTNVRIDDADKKNEFYNIAKKILLEKEYTINNIYIELLGGWYSREVYEGQDPFRWMRGRESSVLIGFKTENQSANFKYKCPDGGNLTISSMANNDVLSKALKDGWNEVSIKPNNEKIDVVNLKANKSFEFKPDTRDFGCQVTDFEIL